MTDRRISRIARGAGEEQPKRSLPPNAECVEPAASSQAPAMKDDRPTSSAGHALLVEEALARPAGAADPVPAAMDLLHAIRDSGHISHPVSRWARELAQTYLPVGVEAGGCTSERILRRSELMHTIDLWAERHVPQHRRGTALHTETLGSVIDRIASACVSADCALASHPAHDPVVHLAWIQLAQLVVAYADLISDIVTGRRRLPIPTLLH